MKKENYANPLVSKAVLASVTVRHWTGRKLDRNVTDEINTRYAAASDAGRYNKELIPRAAFADIYACVNSVRVEHRRLTSPWLDEGTRILPTALFDDFATKMRAGEAEFFAAVQQFHKAYPSYVAAAPGRLKDMFNQEDYPPPNKLKGMFAFQVDIMPCPDANDFRVSLAKEQMEDLRHGVEERVKSVLTGASRDAARRVTEVVGRMAERLKAYKPGDPSKGVRAEGTFRESLVGNVRALVEILPALNLTDDPRLTELVRRMEDDLCASDPVTLREDARVRKAVTKAADDVLKQAEALMA